MAAKSETFAELRGLEGNFGELAFAELRGFDGNFGELGKLQLILLIKCKITAKSEAFAELRGLDGNFGELGVYNFHCKKSPGCRIVVAVFILT